MNDFEAGTSAAAVTEDFDVFLNHRGPDVKATFVAHLASALRGAGFRPFLDARSLMMSDPALKSIDEALDRATVHVAVVSSGYAESKYCLNELVAMTRSGKPVIPVFYGVEPVHLRRIENGPLAKAFEKHELEGRTETRVQETWRDALAALAGLTGFRLSEFKSDEAQLTQQVVNEVARLTPCNDPIEVQQFRVGLASPTNSCIQMLENMGAGVGLLGLVGMGGVGKTTLAREIYNHYVAEKKFRRMTFLEIQRDPSCSNVHVTSTWSRELRKQLLWDLFRVQDSSSNYGSWFLKVSALGPVCIVIDNVDKPHHFEDLVPFTCGLPPGSRIIVTSRDRSILNIVAGRMQRHQHFYDVSTLRPYESNTLFNWHAFHAKEAPVEYKDLAKDVVEACGGLPLALKVMGSSLFDKTLDGDRETIWREAIDALRQRPDVMGVLRWSYDNLPESEQLMFVDITCMFYDKSAKEALVCWESCKSCPCCGGVRTPHTSLRNLMNKCLVVQSDGFGLLRVHDLLRDLGQEIGMKTKRHFVDDRHAEEEFVENQGLVKTIGINLGKSRKRKFEVESFASMPNLHFLRLPNGCDVNGDFGRMPKKLRLLEWRCMPLARVPMGLNLSLLTSIDFSGSSKLALLWIESNVSLEGCGNLQMLNLENCKSITKLPDSIGQSSRLVYLNLSGCENLKKLPNSTGHLKALEQFKLGYCTSLKRLPDTIGGLSNLKHLDMYNCSKMKALPDTTGGLSNLQRLNLGHCRNMKALPDTTGGLSNLQCLNLGHCRNMKALPDTIGGLSNLQRLNLGYCSNMKALPDTIGGLSNLQDLCLSLCSSMEALPDTIGGLSNLQHLGLSDCNSMEALPDTIGGLSNLQHLDLSFCNSMEALPDTIGGLSNLQTLDLRYCNSMKALPDTVGGLSNLQELDLGYCRKMKALPDTIGWWIVKFAMS